ncbi:glycosyltransferase family 39 protein [Planctomicrobium sp. SH668]|uniref:glycosyltransferase family 39 protein n=1 Tax=Planctomicrobium sp. SH668 TaxID=3448126 RepID=UPI003F5C72F4
MSWDGALQRRHLMFQFSPIAHFARLSRRDPTIGFFWAIVTVHVIVWTILATATQPNLPNETLEMLTSGREFAWGYASHPPLGVWIATAVSSFFAPWNWPVYMLAQLCGVVSVWAAWKLGRQFLHPWTALCAAFVLLGGYSCTIAASAFNGDQLASALWSLSIYSFYTALTNERRRYWAATGLCLALGFLASYGTLLLLLTMFIFTLINDRARRCWDSSWPFLSGIAMVTFLMPHLVWLAQNQFLTVQAGIERSASVAHHLIQPLSFLGTQLLCVVPVILLLTPLVAWFSFEEPVKSEDEERDFGRRYLLWLTCLPPAIIFGLSLMAGPSSALFAGVTNWSYLGVVLLMWGHLSETRLSWRRSIIRIGAAVGLFAATLVALTVMVPQIKNQGANTQFPGEKLSQQVESAWKSAGFKGKPPIVAGNKQLVQNAAWYSTTGSTVKTYTDLNPGKNVGMNDQTLLRNGGVVIWDADSDQLTPVELQNRIPNANVITPVNLKWQTDANVPPFRLGMAVVRPSTEPQPTRVQQLQPAGASPAAPFRFNPNRASDAPLATGIPLQTPSATESQSLPFSIDGSPRSSTTNHPDAAPSLPAGYPSQKTTGSSSSKSGPVYDPVTGKFNYGETGTSTPSSNDSIYQPNSGTSPLLNSPSNPNSLRESSQPKSQLNPQYDSLWYPQDSEIATPPPGDSKTPPATPEYQEN